MSTYLLTPRSATGALCAVAAALLMAAPGLQAQPQDELHAAVVPQRVDDFDRSPVAEPMWVNLVARGNPRVDDFNVAPAVRTWVNHVDRGSPRVDDFDASPAR
jgi:hypothetical protein